ncbi:MAG: eukaryotic-like serine/threonine-protein kinase, partial [Acidobacteriota bacterium]|nr:eukaryotic-like serine/threonine-protein kinase [Acidobacteriota bacterium]
VALAAAAALLAWSLARPAPLLAAGERARVALLPIQNSAGDAELDWVPAGLTELVARQLDHLENVEILPSERVSAAIEAATPEASLDSAALPALARRVGADLLIEARAGRAGDGLRIEYRPVRPGGLPGAWRSVAAAEPSEAANLLARQLALRLAPESPQVELRDRLSADPLLNRLYAMGIARLRTGGGQVAEGYFRVCVDRDPDFAWARAELAKALLERGDFDAAEKESGRAEEQAERSGDRALLATARLRRSLVLQRRGESSGAEELARHAVGELRAGDDHTRLAEALAQLGQIAWERDDLDAAERLNRESLALARQSGDALGSARALRSLGVVADARWQLDRAIRLFREALDAIAGEEVPVLRATILNSLGISLHYAGRLDEAESAIRTALELNRGVANPAGEVANLVNLGDLALRRADWAGAIEALRPAVEIADRLGFPRGQGLAAINLAHALIHSGRTEEAETALATAARILGEEEWNVVGNRALLAYLRGDFTTAVAGLERAQRLAGANWQESEDRLLAIARAAAADGRLRPLS